MVWQKGMADYRNTYFEKYTGYISSHDYRNISEKQLENTLSKIKSIKEIK